MTRRTRPAAERFWEKVVTAGDCWQWSGALLRNGYGYFGDAGRSVLAHRWAYRHMVGEIPAELVIDHLCRNRVCVNPDHLEAVPQRVNLARGVGVGGPLWTHCAKGHAMTDDNVDIRRDGGRRCSTCRRNRENEYKQRRRVALVGAA